MVPLNDIANRLTPSVPMQITYGAQPVATGRKYTTLFGHVAASGVVGTPYQVYQVINVGDPAAAKAEVDALAGSGSQIGKMAYAFVNANAAKGGTNFPAFRVVLIPNAETHFGSASEALNAVKSLRSDMLVSCYPASDATNKTTLLDFTNLISGIDRDLMGQFGSFMTLGSIAAKSTAYTINSRNCIVAHLPDTNTAALTPMGVLTEDSNVITALSSTAGIYPGATISGTGVPAGALAGVITASTVTMVDANGDALPAAADEASETITFQNVVAQASEIVAAAHAGAMMATAFPYRPLQGVVVGGLLAPQKSADHIQIDPNGDSEAELNVGNSPLYIQANGSVAFIRSRTTYILLPDNVTAATSYIDWQDIVALYDFREDMYQVSQNPPFNNNPGGSKATQSLANFFRDELLRVASDYESGGAFQNVKDLAPYFVVAPSASSRGRFDFRVPADVTPGLMVLAGNIVAISDLSQLASFTL